MQQLTMNASFPPRRPRFSKGQMQMQVHTKLHTLTPYTTHTPSTHYTHTTGVHGRGLAQGLS